MLKNVAGLTSQAALDRYEARMSALRAEEPLPAGRLSVRHFQSIHRHLFQDIYPWAGKFRTVRISKGSSMFCYPENIAAQMAGLFRELGEKNQLRSLRQTMFATEVGRFLATLNAIHCFRDGNGRAQLAFITLLCHLAGHPIDFARFDATVFLDAMIKSFKGNEVPLAEFFRNSCA